MILLSWRDKKNRIGFHQIISTLLIKERKYDRIYNAILKVWKLSFYWFYYRNSLESFLENVIFLLLTITIHHTISPTLPACHFFALIAFLVKVHFTIIINIHFIHASHHLHNPEPFP